MGAEDQLQELAANLRKLDAVGTRIATEALPGVLKASRATAAAGTDPDGNAWAPTKDGRAALPNAANAITAVVSGSTRAVLTLILKGVYVYHQRSKSKGKKGLPRRVILDITGVPQALADEIGAAAKRVIRRTMGGSS